MPKREQQRRFFNLEQYPEIQVSGGTIDDYTKKSIYLQLKTHLFSDDEEAIQELKYFFFGIKQSIYKHLKDNICYQRFISDIDFSESFKHRPYSYVIMDFTFYPNDKYDKQTLTRFLDELVNKIRNENFFTTPFRLYRTKPTNIDESKNIHRIRTSCQS